MAALKTYRPHQRGTNLRRRMLRLAVLGLAALCHNAPAQVTLVLTPGSSMGTAAGSGADGKTIAGAAASAALGSPQGVVYDAAGNLYIVDARNHQVVRVDTAGQLTVVAGTGRQGFDGDGGAATAAELNAPTGIALDSNNNLYIADTGNQRVRRIGTDGTIATVAGTGLAGFSGDGGAANAARLRWPSGLAMDSGGALYIADTGNHRIRKLQADGTIVTVAGNGSEGDDGDGGAALAASLEAPSGLALLPDGRLLVADRAAHRLRALNTDGTLTAYSGGSTIPLRRPTGVVADAAGTVSIADAGRQQVVQGSDDGGSVLAGNGEQGTFTAGPPSATSLDSPSMIAVRSNGELAVSDRRNHQVQRVTLPLLAFGSVPAGGSSAAQTVTLQNSGAASLQVLAFDLPGSFGLASGGSCALAPFTLPAGQQCTEAVLFAPTAQGNADGAARVRINGAAPLSLFLTGSGSAGGALAGSITALRTDGSIAYAGTPVTLTATVAGSLLHSPGGNVTFLDGSSPLAAAALTNGTASFTSAGLQTGQHTLQAVYSGDAVYRSSTSSALGFTVVPSPDFTLAAGAKSYSGKSGGNIVVPMTLVPLNGTLNHVVQFAAMGVPTGATVVFAPATLTLGGDSVTLTMTVQLPATVARNGDRPRVYMPVACVLLIGFLLYRRRRLPALCLVVLWAGMSAGLSGCGSGYRSGVTQDTLTGATAQTSIAVVTATTTGILGAALSHTSSVALVVSK